MRGNLGGLKAAGASHDSREPERPGSRGRNERKLWRPKVGVFRCSGVWVLEGPQISKEVLGEGRDWSTPGRAVRAVLGRAVSVPGGGDGAVRGGRGGEGCRSPGRGEVQGPRWVIQKQDNPPAADEPQTVGKKPWDGGSVRNNPSWGQLGCKGSEKGAVDFRQFRLRPIFSMLIN